MSKYYCPECGEIFSEPHVADYPSHDYFQPDEYITYCPECGEELDNCDEIDFNGTRDEFLEGVENIKGFVSELKTQIDKFKNQELTEDEKLKPIVSIFNDYGYAGDKKTFPFEEEKADIDIRETIKEYYENKVSTYLDLVVFNSNGSNKLDKIIEAISEFNEHNINYNIIYKDVVGPLEEIVGKATIY